jgi:hypothetical protein
MENYYDLLGIKQNSTLKELKKAYKEKLKQYHPDLFTDKNNEEKSNAENLTKKIIEAYSILLPEIEKQKKQKYGEKLERGNAIKVKMENKEWDYSYFYKEYEKLKKLYKIPDDEQINKIVYFIMEQSKNNVSNDYYKWTAYSFIALMGMPIKYWNLTDFSSELFLELHNPYHKAQLIYYKCMELLHYDKIMSLIDECILWGGNKKKFTLAEINIFFTSREIRVRFGKLKRIFYLRVNEKLKKNTNDDTQDAYVIEYLNQIKFSSISCQLNIYK